MKKTRQPIYLKEFETLDAARERLRQLKSTNEVKGWNWAIVHNAKEKPAVVDLPMAIALGGGYEF